MNALAQMVTALTRNAEAQQLPRNCEPAATGDRLYENGSPCMNCPSSEGYPNWEAQESLESNVGRLRAAMRSGSRYAGELARTAGISPSLVMPLLKHDLSTGRVVQHRDGRGRISYAINDDFDADLQRRLGEAKALLARHGYIVTRR